MMSSNGGENARGGLLVRILGLLVAVILIWFAFAVLQGVFKILVVVLCVALAGVLIWRFVNATTPDR